MKKGYGKIPIEKLVECDWNYKVSDPDDEKENMIMDSLEQNFKRNGQVENILVRELDSGFYEVVNGNHRLRVAVRLKMNELMCFNFGKISQPEAIRIAVETNETRFKNNEIELAKRVAELATEFDIDELCSTLPYDQDEIAKFEKLVDFDWEDFNDENNDAPASDSKPQDFKMIRYDLPVAVAEQFETQLERFKKILYPDEKPALVSYIMPIEAMIQALQQIDDKNIIGKGD